MRNPARVYVDPLFKKKLKGKAVESNKSILDLTRDIAKRDDPLENMFNKNGKKYKKFGFKFP